MSKKLNNETFIEKAKKVYGDIYNYNKVNYINSLTKVCIVCPKHGEFWQIPSIFLYGHGCPKCGIEKRVSKRRTSKEVFIEKAKQIHGDKYDYSKVEYLNNRTKVCIICPEHGEFWQTPSAHLKGQGCPKCGIKYISQIKTKNINFYIKIFKQIHNNKYDYSKVKYNGVIQKICIICPEHGEFWQTVDNHLHGHGCPECAGVVRSCTKQFIEKAKQIHDDKYDYSKVEYKNNKTKICIICPEHGEFWQTPSAHLRGQGCPRCQVSVLEERVEKLLIDNHIKYERQKRFVWLRNDNPSNNKYLSLDFYLPDYNVAIECQGIQHFEIVDAFGGSKGLKTRIKNDNLKFKLCHDNNIKLLYFSHLKYKEMITNEYELLKKIYDVKKII